MHDTARPRLRPASPHQKMRDLDAAGASYTVHVTIEGDPLKSSWDVNNHGEDWIELQHPTENYSKWVPMRLLEQIEIEEL